jgi:hypothetical protein
MYMTRAKTRASHRITTLQRRWRANHLRIDPITRECVRFPIFVHAFEGGNSVFSANTLAEYVLASGDYRNPLTRQPFNRCEVLRLARISGVSGIVDQESAEKVRNQEVERESLRAWFMGEMENDIYLLRDFAQRPTSNMPYSTSFVVRQMLAVTFPSLIVNIVRILRLGEFYAETLFSQIRSTVDVMRTTIVGEEALTPQFTTSLVVFRQFIDDLEQHVHDGTLMSGTTANVVIGGMNIRLNLRDI